MTRPQRRIERMVGTVLLALAVFVAGVFMGQLWQLPGAVPQANECKERCEVWREASTQCFAALAQLRRDE